MPIKLVTDTPGYEAFPLPTMAFKMFHRIVCNWFTTTTTSSVIYRFLHASSRI